MNPKRRPNADLAAVTVAIHPDGRIEITGKDDLAQGRVFAWLCGQIQEARVCISDKVFTPEQAKAYDEWRRARVRAAAGDAKGWMP